jgi:ABC-type multidrug transport system fused ATPase/permease subunit
LIDFLNVTFAYNGGENILKSISFGVPQGQFVAFAGPSGGGKSTLFKLLLGCYPVKDGTIFVDGKPMHAYSLADLRDRIAYVPQDAYLFSGTILENIRYGKPSASEEQIVAAAKAAFAHDFVVEFPGGYQTVVGERGARLSGGQRQRIAIARALLKDAPILLLDEATSALDSESEQIVQRALEVLMKGRTTLVIAHRFSTIVNADAIYVIDGGKVVEQGKHAELMSRQGVYANLYEMQFKQVREAEITTAY